MKIWGFYHNTYPQLLFLNEFSQWGNKSIWKIFEKKVKFFFKTKNLENFAKL